MIFTFKIVKQFFTNVNSARYLYEQLDIANTAWIENIEITIF